MRVYVYASVCDFVCRALLLPFVVGFCLSVFCFLFIYLKNFFLNYFLLYFNNFILFYYFILFYFILLYLRSFFLSFFLPFILSCVDERLLVLQPGIRAMPLRWESQLQDTGPQETSQLHVIPNDKNLSEISISTSRPSFIQRPASYSVRHLMPNNYQDRNTTPSICREAA